MDVSQQVAPEVRTTPYQSPMHQFSGSILMLTNPQNDLHEYELFLRGLMETQEGDFIPVGDQLLSDEGIGRILGQMQARINQATFMSDMEENQIRALVAEPGGFVDALCVDLMVNRVRYKIDNPAARDVIVSSAASFVFAAMCRAKEGGERRFWKGSQQEITTRVDGLQGKKGGVLGKLMGWAGGK